MIFVIEHGDVHADGQGVGGEDGNALWHILLAELGGILAASAAGASVCGVACFGFRSGDGFTARGGRPLGPDECRDRKDGENPEGFHKTHHITIDAGWLDRVARGVRVLTSKFVWCAISDALH